jgi:hypothetical protein
VIGVCKVSAGGVLPLIVEFEEVFNELEVFGRGKRLIELKNLKDHEQVYAQKH